MADVGGITGKHLRAYIERVERLHEERKALADDIRDVFAEAKGNGFDVKIMREVLKLRKMEPADRQEREMLLETYLAALGMTPAEFEVEDDEDEPLAQVHAHARGSTDWPPASEAVAAEGDGAAARVSETAPHSEQFPGGDCRRPDEASARGERHVQHLGTNPADPPNLSDDDDLPDFGTSEVAA